MQTEPNPQVAVERLEEAVAGAVRRNVTHRGPHPTPIPVSPRKAARRRQRAGRKAARRGR